MRRLLLLAGLIVTTVAQAQNYQFLGSYTSDGTPLYFDGRDVVSSSTIQLIQNSLPENYPVPTYNPQYISAGYDTDVVVDALADVWVTFVSEGAGYKNVLGFYTYDINNPPTTKPTASQITIIFPNVSASGSGGSLITGDKVKIGTFPAGTGIGWVLLANAWNGSTVTSGLWQLYSNPAFNPEADPAKKQHNVLLNDAENQRVIMGFEDIRRDNTSCDNDFNDAVFYVTANPYEAIRSSNFADVTSAADVTSGNNGGLESNGDLASLISVRNFKRIKQSTIADKKYLQLKLTDNKRIALKSSGSNLSSYMPQTGMFGTESSHISSPDDLIEITNAKEIFSVDYYEGSKRLAVALATYTENSVYNHSKVICDRLNNSSLEDIRTVNMNGYDVIMTKIKRENNVLEYALSFSIQDAPNAYNLYSYWNIAQFPKGNFYNFQIWGSSMGQVSHIANHIMEQFKLQKEVTNASVGAKIPSVFVKNGYYRNGNLYLKIVNKTKDNSLKFIGSKKATEKSETTIIEKQVSLSGLYEEQIIVNANQLFDIGISIIGSSSQINDALYLADGPWGLDYLPSDTRISQYNVTNSQVTLNSNEYHVERNTAVSGSVYGTCNLFRNVLAGDLYFDVKDFESVKFNIVNNLPVEVILVTENLDYWDERLSLKIPANTEGALIDIPFEKFRNKDGKVYENEKVKGFVFSVQGNYQTFQAFNLNVSNVILGKSNSLGNTSVFRENDAKMYIYPNPLKNKATMFLPSEAGVVYVKVYNTAGSIVQNREYKVQGFSNEVELFFEDLSSGMYIVNVVTDNDEKYEAKIVIK